MRGKDFERFAKHLAKGCPKRSFQRFSSACYRTAISRLYYGILHQTKEWLNRRGIHFKDREIGRIHLIVRNRIEKIDPEAADILKKLHNLRKIADYELDAPVDYPEWRKALYYKRRLGL